MKITIISDTHGKHREVRFQETTDLLIHAGDFTRIGGLREVSDFLEWYAALPHPTKILVGGNHDFLLEKSPGLFRSILPDNIIYLENEGIEIDGLYFWGSPITPYFHNWAFNRYRGADIRKYWEKIPEKVDILITHGPPYGYGDLCLDGRRVGCSDLLEIIEQVQPQYHIFGHIHESKGTYHNEFTTFINASCLDLKYRMVHEPVLLEIDNSINN